MSTLTPASQIHALVRNCRDHVTEGRRVAIEELATVGEPGLAIELLCQNLEDSIIETGSKIPSDLAEEALSICRALEMDADQWPSLLESIGK